MSVYVDILRDWGWRLGPSCHMIADTNEELHEMAKRIGMKRSWFQTDLEPHYDFVSSKRNLAVRYGAIELEDRPFHEILKKWRAEAVAQIEAAKTEEERDKIRKYLYR